MLGSCADKATIEMLYVQPIVRPVSVYSVAAAPTVTLLTATSCLIVDDIASDSGT